MADRTAALAYLRRSPVHHMDMLQAMQRGTGEIIAADAGGVLMRETESGALLLTASTRESAAALLAHGTNAPLMAVHQRFAWDMAAERFGLRPTMECYQAAWMQESPPEVPKSDFTIRPLSVAWADTLMMHYGHACEPAYMQGRLAAGVMLGAFSGEALAGFIGLHEEGSMGMLEVLPAFRRMGLGTLLAAYLSGWLCKQGLTPFSQFTKDNVASRALHEAMGFAISTEQVFWLE